MPSIWSVIWFGLFVHLGICIALLSGQSSTRVLVAIPALLAFTVLPSGIAKGIKSLKAVLNGFTWWQLLWLLLFVSGLVFRDRDYQVAEAEPLDFWALFRVIFVSTAALLLVVRLALSQTNWLMQLFRGLTGVLAGYCLISLASTVWSVYPSWTLYRSGEFLIDVAALAAFVCAARGPRDYKRLLDWTWTLEGLLLASVWVGMIVDPADALLPSGGLLSFQLFGVWPNVHANTIGEIGAVLGVVAFVRLISRRERSDRMWYGLILTAALLSMGLAQARSGILGFAVGVVCVLLLSGRYMLGSALAAAAIAAFSIGNVSHIFSDFMRRGETESELYTLSSRVDWWSYAWPKILDHPFRGYGGFAGSRFFVMAEYRIDVAGIHSDWVETLVGIGFGGFLLAVTAVLASWKHLLRAIIRSRPAPIENQLVLEAIGVLAVLTVRSFFSSSLFWHPPMMFFAIIGYAEYLRARSVQQWLPACSASRIPAIVGTYSGPVPSGSNRTA